MLYKTKDPSPALFISEGAAEAMARKVLKSDQRVLSAKPIPAVRRGEMQGFKLLINMKSTRLATFLSEGDIERVHWNLSKGEIG